MAMWQYLIQNLRFRRKDFQDKISKTYEYHIYNAQMPNPLKTRYCTFVSFPLDIGAMREGAKYLIGAHDFVSFCNIRTNTQDTVRTVYDLTIEKKDDEVVLRITWSALSQVS